ncbi:MAG: biosynthetic-type acetolactate synthase large subunit [Gammaproteobacteria bacterium]|nr:biosynthetic-type acetolactate synthase large subunit [Gammaproteobacteria bacterium]MCP5195453.1 biosynthetic-type acetolactate synthase large subunit [Gammaproteobacteria bacterium]
MQTPAMQSGAGIAIDVLNELGVEYLFGHTGGAVIPLHAELNLRMRQGRKTPRFILFRQEGGAGHAAEGYARASGKTGVALATSGPGATNLITPIADAYKDSIPCVFITGQVPSAMLGKDAFQEVDMVGLTRSISKHNYLIKEAGDLAGVLRQAFFVASSNRPGPVVVDICKNALIEQSTDRHPLRLPRGYRPQISMHRPTADRLLAALSQAKRPVILAGGGIVSAEAGWELRQFIKKRQLPITLTFMGLGAVNHDHPLFLGMPGMHGTVAANRALREADFILSIGARFDDRVAVREFGQGKIIAHVDIDATEIGKAVLVDYPLRANARDFLIHANRHSAAGSDIGEWLSRLKAWKTEYAFGYPPDGNSIKPQQFIEELSRLTDQTSIVVTGVGQHQMWSALFYNYQEPRQWISSGGLGTMGFGLPAAIGACYARPDRTILCIDGDGSFQMNLQELATIAAHRIPVKVFILNNGFLGMVRQWEDMFNQGHHYETCLARTVACDPGCIENRECRALNPNYLNLGQVFPGIETVRISRPDEMRAGIKQALAHDGPCVVDVWIDRTEDVKPMIPPGGTLADMIHDFD